MKIQTFLILVAALLMTSLSYGQDRAAIRGTITDPSGALVSGAHVEQAEWKYASNNLHRLEPLLAKQFVTADQVDRARTSEISQSRALKQAEAQLRQAQAALQPTLAEEQRSRSTLVESKADHERAQNAVTTLEPLVNQRGSRVSAIETARYNLAGCTHCSMVA